jgi:hypothetical protein
MQIKIVEVYTINYISINMADKQYNVASEWQKTAGELAYGNQHSFAVAQLRELEGA